MTPPFTGLCMKAAGLGKIHEEIEAQKRERRENGKGSTYSPQKTEMGKTEVGRSGKKGPGDQNPSLGQTGQSSTTRSQGSAPASRVIIGSKDEPIRFPRIPRTYLSRETLDKYEIKWHLSFEIEDHIQICAHLTQHELDLLREHTIWVREGRELDLMLSKATTQMKQRTKLRESKGYKERIEAEGKSKRRHGRGVERAPARDDQERDDQERDGGHVHVPQPGTHTHADQAQKSQTPTEKEVSTAQPIPPPPSPPHPSSQRSLAPSMSSRLAGPFSPHDYPITERPRQPSPQSHGSRSPSRPSQAPFELPATPVLRAREPTETRTAPETTQQSSRPYETMPGAFPASREQIHITDQSEQVFFTRRPQSDRRAREGSLRPAASESARQGFSRRARNPERREARNAHEGPSSGGRGNIQAPGPRWEDSGGGTGRYRRGRYR